MTFNDLLGTVLSAFKIGRGTIDASALSAARTYTLPDLSGEIAVGPNDLLSKRISGIFAGSGNALTFIGGIPTSLGTITHPTTTSTNRKTKTYRAVWTSAATAGALIYQRLGAGEFARERGFMVCRIGGLATIVTGFRFFAGVADVFTNPTNVDPLTATTPGRIGIACNANTGNLSLVHNASGSAPSVINLGAEFPINIGDLWQLEISCNPGGNPVVTVTNQTSGITTTQTLTTNIPALTTLLAKQWWASNNATASACAIDQARFVNISPY